MSNYNKSLKTTLQITDKNIKILDKTEKENIKGQVHLIYCGVLDASPKVYLREALEKNNFDRFKALINDKSTLPRYMFTAIKTLRNYRRQIKKTMY